MSFTTHSAWEGEVIAFPYLHFMGCSQVTALLFPCDDVGVQSGPVGTLQCIPLHS